MKQTCRLLLITSENTTTSIPLELAGMLNRYPDIEIHVFTYYGIPENNPAADFFDNIQDLNLPKGNLIKGFSVIKRLIKEIKPDIIHVHHNVSALITILAAKMSPGSKKIIKTEHNDHRFYKWHQKLLNIPILALSNKVICNSKSTLQSYYPWERFIAAKKSGYIYNGINTQKIIQYSGEDNYHAVRKKYNILPGEKLFVCASRFTRQKNLSNLIKGFAAAAKENGNIKLVLAGNGELREELVALKNELDIDNKILFVGMLSRQEVFQLINAADFFTIVSLWEGFCNAAVEAMVAHCPMICSDIGTLREVVGSAGYFVEPLSVESIKKAILYFSGLDENILSKMRAESHSRAIELYSIEKTAEKYIECYHNMQNVQNNS